MLKVLNRQGNAMVVRDADQPTRPVVAAQILPKDAARKTWRSFLKRLTNNGEDLFANIHNIAQGQPFSVTLPDGTMSEPRIPTPEVRLQANMHLLEFLFGKAVAQTEVVKAEEQSQEIAQIEAMSDADLKALVLPYLQRADTPDDQ